MKRKTQEDRPILSLQFDPKMPAVQPMLLKHYRSMISQDSYRKEVFSQPPLTAFRRQQNLRNFLIKSKVPPPTDHYSKRILKGMKKCGKSCPTCSFVKEVKDVVTNQNQKWILSSRLTCESYNIVYLLKCEKCGEKYIGSTVRQLKHRLADHKGYITNQVTNRATGAHITMA